MATPETEVPDELEPLEEPEPAEPDPADDPEDRSLAVELGGFRSSEFVFRSAEGEVGILEGRMLPYNEWARIDSFVEGRFYEQFRPRSLAKTLSERADRMRVLFQHGKDFLGGQAIARFESFRDEADGVWYRANLLKGLPDLLLDGLRNGQYGSSIHHKPIKQDVARRPGKSTHNPEGWEERSISEAQVREFSVVTFPAYAGATASMRCLTDDIYAERALEHPELLLQHLRAQAEPTHSEPAPAEDPPGDTGSRDTQLRPKKDWLTTERTAPPWHIP